MKLKLMASISLLGIFHLTPASAATLGASVSVTPNGGLFNYAFTFSVAGTGSIDNVFLGSDDLSPLNVLFTVNGAATTNWVWIGNDVPQDYLQFFSSDASTLGSGDSLGVRFSSSFAPAATHFAQALNSGTNVATNRVTNVAAPTAVPEPASFWMLLAPLLIIGVLRCGTSSFRIN